MDENKELKKMVQELLKKETQREEPKTKGFFV